MKLKAILKRILDKMGYSLISNKSLASIQVRLSETEDSKYAVQLLALLESMKVSNIERFTKYGKLSKAQLLQDIFVLENLNFRQEGFFVEFGAADGIKHSNTYMLEKEFNWKGILAEPATIWHQALYANRNAIIDTRCVWTKSGASLEFVEDISAELSSATEHRNQGIHQNRRADSKFYRVDTISLSDLLLENNAPKKIEYLSVDTEGSEYKILSAFNWNEFRFQVISVEHNFSKDRKLISDLLISKGYKQVYPEVSKFDDWYVHQDLTKP